MRLLYLDEFRPNERCRILRTSASFWAGFVADRRGSFETMKMTVLGAGAWGTSLARLLARSGHAVTLWARDPDLLNEISLRHENERFLPRVELPASLKYDPDLSQSVREAEIIVIAVPSQGFRSVVCRIPDCRAVMVSVTKGIEQTTGLTMSGILKEIHPRASICCLSGPSFAAEVAADIPTAVVAGGEGA